MIGLNVYRGVYKEIADLDSGTKKKMPCFSRGCRGARIKFGIHDGVFMSQFASLRIQKKGTGIVPEEEETIFSWMCHQRKLSMDMAIARLLQLHAEQRGLVGNVGNFMLPMILATPTQYVQNASRTSAAAICSVSSRA